MIKIPFNKPSFIGNELKYIKEAVMSGKISGDGMFSKKCTDLIKKKFSAKSVFLTPSGTAALDMTALLLNLTKGDEVIVPSFTFTSTVNAFVLYDAVPVFVDIRQDTLNIDENKIEEKITQKTKAIYCMHYAGTACEMDKIMKIAKKHGLFVVEDAAQAMNAKYKDKFLGTIGDMGIYSFHETKNYNCGEGGAILINNPKYISRAEIIREKGTDRAKFFRGEVDKYTWRDIGSSYLLSDVLAAYLYAQLENLEKITNERKRSYNFYFNNLHELEKNGILRLPSIPRECRTNYHIFYILLDSEKSRNQLMFFLKQKGILSVFHYLPLNDSPMGRKLGYKKGECPITESLSSKVLRLPLYYGLTMKELDYVQKCIKSYFR
jgi:dTDP-4-amino-4,6-dideoxygalactose transaminase